jgi:glycosyltransferase involved in cell wall biosynthesis
MEGVSIVICCFNSSERIRETLRCLQNQVLESSIPWEVITVDNCSTDNTLEIIKSAWNAKPVAELTILNETEQGQTYARKKGLDHAKFEFVSFVDDDNRVDPTWVENVYYTLLNHPDCAACNGISSASFEANEPWWFKNFELNFAVGSQGTQSGYVPLERGYLFGAGLSVRKSALLDLYNRNYPAIQSGRLINELRGGGEDSELCFGLLLCGYRLYYNEKIRFFHYMPASRMTEKGLKRIQTSIGRDEVVLSMYRSILNRNFYPKKTWWLELLAYFKHYLVFILKNFSISKKKGFLFRTRLVYHHAYMSELIHLRKKYNTHRNTIHTFVNNNRKPVSEKHVQANAVLQ